MDESKLLFSQRVVGQSDNTVKVQVPYDPWYLWGQPIQYFLNRSDQPNSKPPFRMLALLSRRPRSGRGREVALSIISDTAIGDSYIAMPPGDIGLTLPLRPDVQVFVQLFPNVEGRVSALRCDRLPVTSIDDAKAVSAEIVNGLELYLTMLHKVPVFIDEWVVESGDREHRRTFLLSPTPSATLSNQSQGAFDPALFAFASLFAEGLRAESPFYRLLCFYNVLEKLIEVVNPRLKPLLEQNTLQYEPLNGTVPADLFENVAPDYVNAKFTSLKAKVQKPYRNAIAHFNLESRIRPFDLAATIEVRTAAIVLSYAADVLLEIARRNTSRLRAAGVAFEFVSNGSA